MNLLAIKILSVLLFAGGVGGKPPVPAVTAFQKMLGVYRQLRSYSERARVEVTFTSGGKIVQKEMEGVTLLFQRPNRLALVIYSPTALRTLEAFSDGKTLTVYESKSNRYTAGPVGADASSLPALLKKRAQLQTILDPLDFICSADAAGFLSGLKYIATEKLDGHPCLIVTGSPKSVTPQHGKKSAAMRWTWYIDKRTSLLRKITGISEPVKGHAGKTLETVRLNISYRILSVQVNPSIPAASFRFRAPHGVKKKPGLIPPWIGK